MPDDNSAISASDAKRLFADWKAAPAIVLAVSGGPDSIALMWLAARWRRALARGPQLVAVTVDHGLRAEAAQEARAVKRLARSLDLTHRTMRWTAAKPKTGLPAAARTARYRLLAQAAQACGATHILTAHTRDDQAETLLMRMLRGSGIAGLAAMARQSEREGVVLARPFLNVSKSRLVATLKKAGIDFADDPTNRDTVSRVRGCARSCRFWRPRAAIRATWRDSRRGLAGPMRRWKSWSMAPSAIWRSGIAKRCRQGLLPTLSTAARLPPCQRKFDCGCCCARSIDTGTKARRNWARSRRCSRRWTAQRRRPHYVVSGRGSIRQG